MRNVKVGGYTFSKLQVFLTPQVPLKEYTHGTENRKTTSHGGYVGIGFMKAYIGYKHK